jgi:hypothetical protein
MECKREKNLKNCNCTYEPCPRQGTCCDCLAYHLRSRELPGCCFSGEAASSRGGAAERTYDRSFEHFARLVAQKKL